MAMNNVVSHSRWQFRKQVQKLRRDSDKQYIEYLQGLLVHHNIEYGNFNDYCQRSNNNPLNLERYDEDSIIEKSKTLESIGCRQVIGRYRSNEQQRPQTVVRPQNQTDDGTNVSNQGGAHGNLLQGPVREEALESRNALSQHLENRCVSSAGSGGSDDVTMDARNWIGKTIQYRYWKNDWRDVVVVGYSVLTSALSGESKPCWRIRNATGNEWLVDGTMLRFQTS
mmetsp:Transcript_13396/g.22023  ORF Transcript_13396/g.22023 Transcript_13396/m.22023 type:complete len:225 (+) Transcript_13396:469-1143(+)